MSFRHGLIKFSLLLLHIDVLVTYVCKQNTCIVNQAVKRYTSMDMKPPGRVVDTLFLTRQLQTRSVENGLLWGQNSVSSTYCMEFSWFESCVLLVQIVCSMT